MVGSDSALGTLASPVRTLQKALDLAPVEGVVCVRGGFYEDGNGQQVWRKPVTVMSAPGEEVVFSGSTVVREWRYVADGVWATDINLPWDYTPVAPEQVTPEHPEAAYPWCVWVNGVKLEQASPFVPMANDQFRYNDHTMYITTDPTDQEVRVGVRQQWLRGQKEAYLCVRGILVRDFCPSPKQFAALTVFGNDSQITDCDFQDISAAGTFAAYGSGILIEHNGFNHCGQLGYHNYQAHGIVIARNAISNCNDRHNSHIGVAGGGKSDQCEGVVHDQNYCVYNEGHDLWADTGSHGAVWTRNVVFSGADSACIHCELINGAVIAGNYTDGGAVGILVSSAANVRVVNNTEVNAGVPFKWQTDNRPDYPQVNVTLVNNDPGHDALVPVDADIAVLLDLTDEQAANPPRGWFGPEPIAEEPPVTDDLETMQAFAVSLDNVCDLAAQAQAYHDLLDNANGQIDTLQTELDHADQVITNMQADKVQLITIIGQRQTEIEALNAKLANCDCPEEEVTLEQRWAPLADKLTLGWSAKPGSISAFEAFNAVIGKPGQSRRVFPSGDQNIEADYAAGRMVMWEIPTSGTVADAEAMRDRIIALAPEPVVVTIGHEEEKSSRNQTSAQFKANWDRLFPILAEAPNAIVVHTWMNASARGNNSWVGPELDDFRAWLPEGAHGIAFDLYVPNTQNLPFASVAKQMQNPLMFAAELGVPMLYGELGIGGTELQRKTYLQEFLTACNTNHVPMVHWFNSNEGDGTPVVYPPTTPPTKTWDINRCADKNPDVLTPQVFNSFMI